MGRLAGGNRADKPASSSSKLESLQAAKPRGQLTLQERVGPEPATTSLAEFSSPKRVLSAWGASQHRRETNANVTWKKRVALVGKASPRAIGCPSGGAQRGFHRVDARATPPLFQGGAPLRQGRAQNQCLPLVAGFRAWGQGPGLDVSRPDFLRRAACAPLLPPTPARPGARARATGSPAATRPGPFRPLRRRNGG
jgi:hypothetical protein